MSKIKNDEYWVVYKDIEQEFLTCLKYVFYDKKQQDVYSIKFAELILRTAMEIESISKELYYMLGGTKEVYNKKGDKRDLLFDTDCIKLINKKIRICEKQICINHNVSHIKKDFIKITPLIYCDKRNTKVAVNKNESQWKKAYQSLKHDRINSMHFATLNNALYAIGALYVLNIYYEFHNLDTIDTYEYEGQYEYTFDSYLFFVEMLPNYLTYGNKAWYYRFLLSPPCAEQINKYILLQVYTQDEFRDICNEYAQVSRMMGYYIDSINDKNIIEELKSKKITCSQAGVNYSRKFNDIVKECIKRERKNVRLIVNTLSFKDNKFNENELKRVLNEIYGNNPYIDSNLKPIDITEQSA